MGARRFLSATFSDRFARSYRGLPAEVQRGVDRVILALVRGEETSGMRVKPILPEKYHLEARANAGDRVIFRREGDVLLFVDVVSHDDIGRYGTAR